jgi:hypothetical protein
MSISQLTHNESAADNSVTEEDFLIDKLFSDRQRLLEHETKSTAIQFELKKEKLKLEKEIKTTEEAFIDFMKGSGIEQTRSAHLKFTLGKSYRVEVESIEAVPEEFIRTKVTKEVDKLKIKNLRPQGNFYTIFEHDKLTITSI